MHIFIDIINMEIKIYHYIYDNYYNFYIDNHHHIYFYCAICIHLCFNIINS